MIGKLLHKLYPRYQYILVQNTGIMIKEDHRVDAYLDGVLLDSLIEPRDNDDDIDLEYEPLMLTPKEHRMFNEALVDIFYHNPDWFFTQFGEPRLIAIPSYVRNWVVGELEDGREYVTIEHPVWT